MRRKGYSYALMPLGGLAVISLVLLLGFQNRNLRQENEELSRTVAELRRLSLGPPVGTWTLGVSAKTLDGITIQMGGGDSIPQVLYFFSPSCRFCAASIESVKHIARRVHHAGNARFVAISEGDPKALGAYVSKNSINFPVVNSADERVFSLFRAAVVPTLVVIDTNGKVVYSHSGVVKDMDADLAISKVYGLGGRKPTTAR